MDRHDTAHWDVAAYALGVLDPQEIERYEAHLADCRICAAELEFLLPASTLLADVDPDDLRQAQELDPHVLDRLVEAVRVERRRARSRRRLTVGAATAVAASVAGLALFAGATWLPADQGGTGATQPLVPSSPTGEPSPPGIGGPELGDGEQFSVTDPDTGVRADLVLRATDWGTQVSFALSSLTGPRECRLLLVHTDGTSEVAASWQVPVEGYGTPQRSEPLMLQTATATPRADLDHVEVEELHPDGTTTTLVTTPV